MDVNEILDGIQTAQGGKGWRVLNLNDPDSPVAATNEGYSLVLIKGDSLEYAEAIEEAYYNGLAKKLLAEALSQAIEQFKRESEVEGMLS